jgi:hypothetical protein
VLALALALAFRAANALLVVRTCFNPDEHWQCLPTASPSGNLAFPSPLLIVSRVFFLFFFFVRARAESRIRLPLDSRECDANRTLSFVENLMPKW